MEPKFQIKHRPHVSLKVAALDAEGKALAMQVKRIERAYKAIERRLGRKHIKCKECGEAFHLEKAAIRMPIPENLHDPVAVCPKCGKDN